MINQKFIKGTVYLPGVSRILKALSKLLVRVEFHVITPNAKAPSPRNRVGSNKEEEGSGGVCLLRPAVCASSDVEFFGRKYLAAMHRNKDGVAPPCGGPYTISPP